MSGLVMCLLFRPPRSQLIVVIWFDNKNVDSYFGSSSRPKTLVKRMCLQTCKHKINRVFLVRLKNLCESCVSCPGLKASVNRVPLAQAQERRLIVCVLLRPENLS